MLPKEEKSKNIRRLAWLIAVIVIYAAGSQINPPKGLSEAGWKSILLIICATLTWVSEFIPMGIASCLLLFLPNLLKLETTAGVMSNFATPTLFFIMSTLIIARAFVDTGFGYRVSLYITGIFGNKSKSVLLALMSCAALISTVLADIPSGVIVGGIAYTILEGANIRPGSKFGKSLMVGIPIAAALGGIATPAGSGVNILTINLLKSVAGIEISFLEWSIIGIPMAIILTFTAWVVISMIFKPEIDVVPGMDNIPEKRKEIGPLTKDEKKFTAIFAVTLVLWFTQSMTSLETAFVSLMACSIFFLPGIELMDWKRANDSVAWNTLMLVGSCNALAMLLSSNGSAVWLSDTFLGGFANSSLLVLVAAVTIFGIFIHLLVPISGAVVALTIPIIYQLAVNAGIDPIYLVLPLGYTASCVFMIPLDPTCLTTFKYGYWKMSDMSKPGFIIAILWIPVLVGIMMMGIKLGFI